MQPQDGCLNDTPQENTHFIWKLERAKGFEPSTPTLARSCSTPELRPLGGWLASDTR
jgi:hypothetical protein